MTAPTLDRARYRRVTELYVVGRELELLDGTAMWLQVLNPFEREEALRDAQVARSRLLLELRDEERGATIALRAMFTQDDREGSVARLVEAKRPHAYLEATDEIANEEDWRDKVQLLIRGGDLATEGTQEQVEQAQRFLDEYANELERRMGQILDAERQRLELMDDEELWETYRDWWVDTRGAELGIAEYRFTEAWLGCRACVAVKIDGEWDHSDCGGHEVRVYSSKDEVRRLPEKLQQAIFAAFSDIEMSERDAHFSDRQGSSFASSPLPDAEVESTRSTPGES